MGDLQSTLVMLFAGLVVLFVPGLVWATVLAGLYQMIREPVAKLLAPRGRLIPVEKAATGAVESRSDA